MALSKPQMIANLKVARANISEKLAALGALETKTAKLTSQRDALTASYDVLNESVVPDVNGARQLREVTDQIQLLERRVAECDAALPRADADLLATLDASFALYGEALRPRIAALETRIAKCLEPFYSNPSTPREIAARSDAVAYLRHHARCEFGNVDPVQLAGWFVKRLDHVLSDPDSVPWPKPPMLSASSTRPQQQQAEVQAAEVEA